MRYTFLAFGLTSVRALVRSISFSVSILFSISAVAEVAVVKDILAAQLRFQFESQDGQTIVPCTHTLQTHTLDWDVQCKQDLIYKRYTVHLKLSAYPHPNPPRLSYEILYWVTDQQVAHGSAGRYLGTTTWVRLNDPSALYLLESSQDVENIFSLKVTIKP